LNTYVTHCLTPYLLCSWSFNTRFTTCPNHVRSTMPHEKYQVF